MQRWDELASILPSYPRLSTVRARGEASGESEHINRFSAILLAFRSGKPTTADPSGAVPGTELAADRAAVVAGGVGVLAPELVGEDRPAPLREALLLHLWRPQANATTRSRQELTIHRSHLDDINR